MLAICNEMLLIKRERFLASLSGKSGPGTLDTIKMSWSIIEYRLLRFNGHMFIADLSQLAYLSSKGNAAATPTI